MGLYRYEYSEVATISDIQVFSDSRYVIDGMNVWMKKWIISFWRTSTGKQVFNQDLWKPLKALSECHKITYAALKTRPLSINSPVNCKFSCVTPVLN